MIHDRSSTRVWRPRFSEEAASQGNAPGLLLETPGTSSGLEQEILAQESSQLEISQGPRWKMGWLHRDLRGLREDSLSVGRHLSWVGRSRTPRVGTSSVPGMRAGNLQGRRHPGSPSHRSACPLDGTPAPVLRPTRSGLRTLPSRGGPGIPAVRTEGEPANRAGTAVWSQEWEAPNPSADRRPLWDHPGTGPADRTAGIQETAKPAALGGS